MGILLYVGAIEGGDISNLLNQFDRILVVQAHPDEAQKLKSAYPSKVEVIHGAATMKHGGTTKLHVASNIHSSSLGPFNPQWAKNRNISITHTIDVPSVSLHQFCVERGINRIDYLVSDVQGGDFDVLASMLPMIERGAIERIRCKTTRDGFHNLHDNLPSNELKSFRALLQPHNYFCVGLGWGELQNGAFDMVPVDWWEFYSLWTIPKILSQTTTYVACLFGQEFSQEFRSWLASCSSPMVIFCDDSNQKLFKEVWQLRAESNLLDSTMFWTMRIQHLSHFSFLEKIIRPRMGQKALETLATFASPNLLNTIISTNPFKTSYFSLINPQSSSSINNVEQKTKENGIDVEEGLMVGGDGMRMSYAMGTISRLFSSTLAAGHLPDTNFLFSKKVALINSQPCIGGGCGKNDPQDWNILSAELMKMREGGQRKLLHSWCEKFLSKCPSLLGSARRNAPTSEGKFWREMLQTTLLAGWMNLAHDTFERCMDLNPETYEFAGKCAKLLAVRICFSPAVDVPVKSRPNLINGNLTILPYGATHYLAVARMINWINGRCIHPQSILTNENTVLLLDSTFKVVREGHLTDKSGRVTQRTGWTGFEDVRLYSVDSTTGTMHFTSSLFDHEGGGKPQIARCMATYVGDGQWEVVKVQPLKRIDPNGEKNWLVFQPHHKNNIQELDENWLAIYHWYPRYHILKLAPNGTHSNYFREEKDRPGSFHQGSCAPIWFAPLDCWLALIHLSWDCFYHRFVLLDKTTLQIKQISPIVYFTQLGIEYACGLCWSLDQTNIVISFGRGDSSSQIITIPPTTITQLFQPVTN